MFSHVVRKLRSLWFRPQNWHFAHCYWWQIADGQREHFDAVTELTSGVLVKQNLQRSIRRIDAVYLKCSQVNTVRSYLRDVLRPPKAQLEFENASALLGQGIAAIQPIAWGTKSRFWPSESVILTHEAAHAEPLADWLERPQSVADQLRIARAFARYTAKLHEGGIDHPDPHPGNFLITHDGQFIAIDLHAICFTNALDAEETLRALAVLNRWFQMRTPATIRYRFWLTYLAHRPGLKLDPRTIETATRASNYRFWTDRLKRYTLDNRETKRISRGSIKGYAERDLPADFVSQLLTEPDALFSTSGVKILKDSRSSTVAVVKMGEREVIFKRFRVKSNFVMLKNALRPTAALRSWRFGRNLIDRGLPTAKPLAMVERFAYGVPREGYIVFEKVPDGIELPQALGQVCPAKLGKLIRTMHDREVSHRDLKAPNILVSHGELVLLDLVGIEVGRKVSDAIRIRDLARLNASFLHGEVSTSVKLRVLYAYLQGDRKAWKTWWRNISQATAAKVAKNARSGRPLA
jgi:tRNA A-37 threonylcarbamoyl transferase component Bud32